MPDQKVLTQIFVPPLVAERSEPYVEPTKEYYIYLLDIVGFEVIRDIPITGEIESLVLMLQGGHCVYLHGDGAKKMFNRLSQGTVTESL